MIPFYEYKEPATMMSRRFNLMRLGEPVLLPVYDMRPQKVIRVRTQGGAGSAEGVVAYNQGPVAHAAMYGGGAA